MNELPRVRVLQAAPHGARHDRLVWKLWPNAQGGSSWLAHAALHSLDSKRHARYTSFLQLFPTRLTVIFCSCSPYTYFLLFSGCFLTLIFCNFYAYLFCTAAAPTAANVRPHTCFLHFSAAAQAAFRYQRFKAWFESLSVEDRRRIQQIEVPWCCIPARPAQKAARPCMIIADS